MSIKTPNLVIVRRVLTGKADRGVTNIRIVKSPHWRGWMRIENRCVVPATSFAEPSPTRDPGTGRIGNVWFAIDVTRPLFFFAGVWTRWHGVRKVKDGEGDFELFAFLTAEPKRDVAPVHSKAIPVILTSREEVETWLTAPLEQALKLQRPLDDALLTIVNEPAKVDA